MNLSTLPEWLSWIESVHPKAIDLGLERVKTVAARLNLLAPPCPVITVAGTNGKGSTVAGLEAIYRAAGFCVGAFTSPVLFKHNEYVRINGETASDTAFCAAYAKIESVRANVSLTPFEFHTLAALLLFQSAPLDVLLLEVGLGGRLDAVNVIDADVAIVTSIDIDHVDWLGPDRDSIAREKAGIFRHARPAVCGDHHVPSVLLEYAMQLGTPMYCQQQDFCYREKKRNWEWQYQEIQYTDLPYNTLAVQNMSSVLMAITLLQDRLAVTEAAIKNGLQAVTLPGRIQIIPGVITEIYDVAHNPAAVTHLAQRLKQLPQQGQTHAVFSMLADKDIATSITAISALIANWYVAPLTAKRAASLDVLQQAFAQAGIVEINVFATIKMAYANAKAAAKPNDCILVFGSFHTVAAVLALTHAS